MRKSRVQRIWENAVVFYLGGMFYCTVELLWRQWTHGSMFLLGGLCFWTVSSLGRRVRMPLLAQMALGACIVTFFEFWTGVLVNRGGCRRPQNARHGRLTVTGALRISAFAVFLHSSSEHNTFF